MKPRTAYMFAVVTSAGAVEAVASTYDAAELELRAMAFAHLEEQENQTVDVPTPTFYRIVKTAVAS